MGAERFFQKLDRMAHPSKRFEIKGKDKAKQSLADYYRSEQDGEFREGVEPPVDVYVNGLYKVVDKLLYKNPEEAPVDKSSNK